MVVPRLIAMLVLLGPPSLARTQQFSSAFIRPSAPATPGESRLRILPSGELIGRSIPVVELLSLAYSIPENPSPRLASLPEWAVRQRFDIEAKTSKSLQLDTKDLQGQGRTIEFLLKQLLSDYFGLMLKVKMMPTPVYALTLSGKNRKLTIATVSPTDCILDTGPDGCHSFTIGFGHPLNARAVDMSDLARYLENWTDLPVVDRTAKSGLFTMHSEGWRPMNLPPPPPGTPGTGTEFANLSSLSAVLSSFGLQLKREEESLPFYTVEHIHQPNAW